MNNTFKRKVENGFFVALGLVGFFGFMLLIFRHPLLNGAMLTTAPVVGVWLWKFYQEKFEQPLLDRLKQGFMVGSLLCAAFLLFTNRIAEAKIDDLFMEGKIRSKVVADENDEGNIVNERRYAFFLQNEKDNWKKEIISWYMWFMIVGSPIICIRCIGSLRPIYDEKSEQRKRFADEYNSR